MAKEQYGFETLQLHAGQTPDRQTCARAVPIYQTTSYCYPNAKAAADVFSGAADGYTYTRIENPTVNVLEERVCALEKGAACVAFSSGMAAVSAAVFALCDTGDHIVAISNLYGGTVTLLPQASRVLASTTPLWTRRCGRDGSRYPPQHQNALSGNPLQPQY